MVGLLHLAIGYALVTGLARKVVEVIKAPLETKIIEEVKKPPPDQPPPPPPKMAAPPPPFIPPPEINIQVPQVTPPPTITKIGRRREGKEYRPPWATKHYEETRTTLRPEVSSKNTP